MKYIMFETTQENALGVLHIQFPVIFPDLLVHAHVSNLLCRIRELNSKPISAGFLTREMIPYGKSESLNLESRSEDEAIIKRMVMMNLAHVV